MDFDEQDGPPDLVETGDLDDEETVKVPITIVTGESYRSALPKEKEAGRKRKKKIIIIRTTSCTDYSPGYLGAGKTTLLNYILTAQHGKKIAVIMNGAIFW